MIHKVLFALIGINFFFVSHAMQREVRFADSAAQSQTEFQAATQSQQYVPAAQSSQQNEEPITIFVENLTPDQILVHWKRNNQEDSRSLVKSHSKNIGNLQTLQELDISPYGLIKGLLGAEALTLGYRKPENLVSRIHSEIDRIRREHGKINTFTVIVELWNTQWWNSHLGRVLPYVFTVKRGMPSKPLTFLWDAFPRVKEIIAANPIEDTIPGEDPSITARKIANNNRSILTILSSVKPRYFLDLPEGTINDHKIERAYRTLVEEWRLEAHGGDDQMQALVHDVFRFINCAYDCLQWGRRTNRNRLRALILAEVLTPCFYDIKHKDEGSRLSKSAPGKS